MDAESVFKGEHPHEEGLRVGEPVHGQGIFSLWPWRVSCRSCKKSTTTLRSEKAARALFFATFARANKFA
jgi:hypothetical protein